jgi:hypothetical protein
MEVYKLGNHYFLQLSVSFLELADFKVSCAPVIDGLLLPCSVPEMKTAILASYLDTSYISVDNITNIREHGNLLRPCTSMLIFVDLGPSL